MSEVGAFVDSSGVVADAAALQERARRDGYLFLPGLVPPEVLLDLRGRILEIVERHRFLAEGSDRRTATARPGLLLREGDAQYMPAYDDIQHLEAFHALAHQPRLIDALGNLFGERVLVHPRNIARVMFPNSSKFTTPAHQDFIHIQGTEDTWTAWIPLGDCPFTLGGLQVMPGSHKLGLLPVQPASGAGGVGIDTSSLELPWHGGEMRCGDVLMFHSLCIHRAIDNNTGSLLRLSVDYRYQGASQPVSESSLLPHFNRETWDQIYAGWTRPELQYYWRGMGLHQVTHSADVRERALRY